MVVITQLQTRAGTELILKHDYMKSFSRLLTYIMLCLFVFPRVFAQVKGDYRSNTILGNWSNAASWEMYNGNKWKAAKEPPSYRDENIAILPGQRIDVDDNVTVNQLTVFGTLFINKSHSLYIYHGPAAQAGLTVEGTLFNEGTLETVASLWEGAVTGPYMVNNGEIINLMDAVMTIRDNTSFDNNGLLENQPSANIKLYGLLNNDHIIGNFGDIQIENATLANNLNGVFNNKPGSQITADSKTISQLFPTFSNLQTTGRFNNDGSIIIQDLSMLHNYGEFFNSTDGAIKVSRNGNMYSSLNNGLGVFQNEGKIEIEEGCALSNSAAFENNPSGTILIHSSELSNSLNLINRGALALFSSTAENTGAFENKGTISMNASVLKNHNRSFSSLLITFANTGKILVHGKSQLRNSEVFRNWPEGIISVEGESTLRNLGAGNFTNETQIMIGVQSSLIDSAGMTNTGRGSLYITQTGKLDVNSTTLKNKSVITFEGQIAGDGIIENLQDGIFNAYAGLFRGNGILKNQGRFSLSGDISFEEYHFVNMSTGLLEGEGFLRFATPNLFGNSGTIAPGNVDRIGTLRILGVNPFSAVGGTLKIDVGASGSCDLLFCNVDVVLSGKLEVTVTNLLAPPYIILESYGNVTGTFNYQPPSSLLSAVYEAQRVVLQPLSSCNVPRNLTVANITMNSAAVHWQAIPEAISYVLQYKPSGSESWQQIPVRGFPTPIPNETVHASLTQLLPDTKYDVRVQSICRNGESEFTPIKSFTTLYDCVPPPFGSIKASNVTYNSAVVSWDPVPGAQQYELRWAVPNEDWKSVSVSGTSSTMQPLIQGTLYVVQVKTICSDGQASDFSYYITVKTSNCPGGTEFVLTNLTNTSASFKWTVIPEAKEYYLYWGPSGGTWKEVIVTGTSYTLSNLSIGTLHGIFFGAACPDGQRSGFTVYMEFYTYNTERAISNISPQNKQMNTLIDAASTAMLQVIPNPVTRDWAKLNYHLANSGKVTVKIADLNGRILRSTDISYQMQGSHVYKLTNLGSLASGYYIIILEQSGNVVGRQQVIIKR